jgi:hypothetical protein
VAVWAKPVNIKVFFSYFELGKIIEWQVVDIDIEIEDHAAVIASEMAVIVGNAVIAFLNAVNTDDARQRLRRAGCCKWSLWTAMESGVKAGRKYLPRWGARQPGRDTPTL